MTATRIPGLPVIEDGKLISTNPATGANVGVLPAASPDDVRAAVERAREASAWWARLGFAGRKARLLKWDALLANRIQDVAELINREGGKPIAEAIVECFAAFDHLAWAARHAERVLRLRKVRASLTVAEHAAYLEYQPYGVIGVIGPWNYPIFTPMGSIAYALAAGNAVVFKPSELTPLVGARLGEIAARTIAIPNVLQVVTGAGATGAALARAAVDKIAFTGSTATARKVMAAAAENLTPIIVE